MGATYEQAGVSLATAEAITSRIGAAVESTRTPSVAGDLGGFAGLYELDGGWLLAASTDGIGTKLILARKAGRLRDAGADLAAHCINDVLTTGAEPLFFLDYVASAQIDLEQVEQLVAGAATVCKAASCAILGGETAEMPDVYRADELDFVGTCVGLVERIALLGSSRVREGDAVVGLPSSGLHANGFTLVRELVGAGPFDAELLLAPTRLYLDRVRELRATADVHALAHITGGGIPGNLARVLPPGLGARIDPTSWSRPRVFDWLAERGVSEHEQRRVFNLGIGMCVVMPPADAAGCGSPVIGEVVTGVDGVVFTEPPSP
ncbi:MAG: phosphoribosylformylglycinamidine cyclo-ligase [Actinomycetia bacterium]|nr:phosphoribosylformylglycinamidine cyclo-ligase [Actinomycetes bacterium]